MWRCLQQNLLVTWRAPSSRLFFVICTHTNHAQRPPSHSITHAHWHDVWLHVRYLTQSTLWQSHLWTDLHQIWNIVSIYGALKKILFSRLIESGIHACTTINLLIDFCLGLAYALYCPPQNLYYCTEWPFMCWSDVPLRNYSLTHSVWISCMYSTCTSWLLDCQTQTAPTVHSWLKYNCTWSAYV